MDKKYINVPAGRKDFDMSDLILREDQLSGEALEFVGALDDWIDGSKEGKMHIFTVAATDNILREEKDVEYKGDVEQVIEMLEEQGFEVIAYGEM